MRLNNDCIRDILLYIEENITESQPTVDVEELISALGHKYDQDTICYHIRQIDKSGLVDDVCYADDGPVFVCDLSWEGHTYVNDIRDNKVWDKLKDVTKGLASVSLSVLMDKAPDIVKSFIK